MDDNLGTKIEKEIEKLNIILINYEKLNMGRSVFNQRIKDIQDDIAAYEYILKGMSLANEWQVCYLDDLQN